MIYSTKSLRGHTLKSAKFGVGSMDNCILRITTSDKDCEDWIRAISQAIAMSPRSANLLKGLSRVKASDVREAAASSSDDDGGSDSDDDNNDDDNDAAHDDVAAAAANVAGAAAAAAAGGIGAVASSNHDVRLEDADAQVVASPPGSPAPGSPPNSPHLPRASGAPSSPPGATTSATATVTANSAAVRTAMSYSSVGSSDAAAVNPDFYFDGWLDVLTAKREWVPRWFVLRQGLIVIFNREEVRLAHRCCKLPTQP